MQFRIYPLPQHPQEVLMMVRSEVRTVASNRFPAKEMNSRGLASLAPS